MAYTQATESSGRLAIDIILFVILNDEKNATPE